MNIDHVEIDWCDDYDNSPRIIVHMDGDIWHGGLRGGETYEAFDLGTETMLVAVHGNGVVRWVLDRSEKDARLPSNMRGAMTGDYPMDDGTTRKVTSGWSSRGECVSEVIDRQVADVTFKGANDSLGMGGGCGLLVSILEKHLPEGVELAPGKHEVVQPKWEGQPTKEEWRELERERIEPIRRAILEELGIDDGKLLCAGELDRLRAHPKYGQLSISPYEFMRDLVGGVS